MGQPDEIGKCDGCGRDVQGVDVMGVDHREAMELIALALEDAGRPDEPK